MTIPVDQARRKAENICARSEKCTFDIEKKLKDWGLSQKESDEVVDKLIEDKFLNDERYAAFFVRDKYRFNRWGRKKISYTLKMKRFPNKTISDALNEIKEEEYLENLHDLLRQKIISTKGKDKYDKKNKVVRFAQGRGYEADLIFTYYDKICREIESEEEEE